MGVSVGVAVWTSVTGLDSVDWCLEEDRGRPGPEVGLAVYTFLHNQKGRVRRGGLAGQFTGAQSPCKVGPGVQWALDARLSVHGCRGCAGPCVGGAACSCREQPVQRPRFLFPVAGSKAHTVRWCILTLCMFFFFKLCGYHDLKSLKLLSAYSVRMALKQDIISYSF